MGFRIKEGSGFRELRGFRVYFGMRAAKIMVDVMRPFGFLWFGSTDSLKTEHRKKIPFPLLPKRN